MFLRNRGIGLCLVWLCLFPYVISAEDGSQYGNVEILRDEWGVPHIFSDTDAGAFYGLGYACAEDRAFQMVFGLRIIQGRVAEVLGDVPLATRRDRTTLWSDKKVRAEGFYRAAQRLIPTLDKEIVTLLQAYCDGVNKYVNTHRENLLHLFDRLGLEPEPWTPADCIASWWHLAKFFAAEGLNDAMVYHRIKDGDQQRGGGRGRGLDPALLERMRRAQKAEPDDCAAVVKRDDVSREWLNELNEFIKKYGIEKDGESGEEGPKFSHAWVVGKEKTTTKSSVLCSDPQTPVRNPSLFHEFHYCGKTFNARGIGVPGSPNLLIGWTSNVAWGLTALGADQSDLFLLKTDGQHPNRYFFDGEWRDMTVWRETVKVKNGDPIEMTLKETHLGPVVTSIANGLRPGEQVAQKRIPICDRGCETIEGYLAMIRARNADEFSKAIHGWRFPSANIVYGDREGNIGYCALAAIPIRSKYALQGGSAAHEGTDSKYDWQTILPYDLLPQVMNPKSGYLFSGNHRPIQSFYDIQIGISTGAMGDTDRSWRLRQRLEGKELFSPKDVLDIHYDMVNAARWGIISMGYYLRDNLKAELSEEALSALGALEDWFGQGGISDNAIAGTELALLVPLQFRIVNTELAGIYGGGQSGMCKFLKKIQSSIENRTDIPNETMVRDYIDDVLSQAWESAVRQYGTDVKQWPSIARKRITQRNLGYMQSLDGFASLDPECDLKMPELSCVDGGTIRSLAAQSYSQWVPMDDVDAALSILPIGNSENPKSPNRLATYELWAKGKPHPAPISRDAVEKIAVSKEAIH